MKGLLLAAIVWLAVQGEYPALAQRAQELPPPVKWTQEQREVWRTIEAWNDAFEANQSERYFQQVDPAITVLTPSNPYRVDGIDADRKEFEFGLARGHGRVSLFQEMQPVVEVVGEMAFAVYYSRGWYGPEKNGRMIYLRETDILVRREGIWKIIHVHVSAAD